MSYDPKSIEPKWQRYWEQNATFGVEVDRRKPKVYVLDMFPYPPARAACRPSRGLHRHRYRRPLQAHDGFNVLHPMGWDAFGLPAERMR